MRIHPWDYFNDRPQPGTGLAAAEPLIEALRAEVPNVLLFDNGDFLQGNPMGDYAAQEATRRSGDPHPMIAAMNALRYDAVTLGNHEFDYGLDALRHALSAARFPVVSANLETLEGAPVAAPFTVLDRDVADDAGTSHRLRIGVLGFSPPQVANWGRHHLEGRIAAAGIVETARLAVPRLRAAGADIVVALAHTGIGAADAAVADGAVPENVALALASVGGIDAMVAGHTHDVFPSPACGGRPASDAVPGTLAGVPAVMAGSQASHVGAIDLWLARSGGKWQVARHEARAVPVVAVPAGSGEPAGAVIAATRAAHAATLDHIRRPVGRAATPLNSYFALVRDDPSVRLVAMAQAWHARGLLDGTPHAGLPILSAAAPFMAGGRGGPANYVDLPAGPVTIRDIAALYPYPNALHILRITGAELALWLERSAALYAQIVPGSVDTPLIDPAFAPYNFDAILGLHYRIDLSRPARTDADGTVIRPAARRVTDIAHRGVPVAPSDIFALATNSYRAGGGGGYPSTGGADTVVASRDAIPDVLRRYIEATGTVDAGPGGGRSFVRMPDTTVTFESASAAAACLPRGCSLGIVPVEPAATDGRVGFATYRLDLGQVRPPAGTGPQRRHAPPPAAMTGGHVTLEPDRGDA